MTARDGSGLFASLATPTSRLYRIADPPDDADGFEAGDMVICDDGWGAAEFAALAAERGVQVRTGPLRYEQEAVIRPRARRGVRLSYPPMIDPGRHALPGDVFDPVAVQASEDSFARTWDALSTALDQTRYEPAGDHLPADWVPFLPFPTLNPAQMQALPTLLSDRPALLVAPTGAGKTAMGMIAALREIKSAQPRKAAWLVPQRSLTAELDRELETWRRQGLKVVALSGESATDTRLVREADLWVATTEKFEALCRASSMREAVAEIGTLVVDEVHLLGEPTRGPLLETLLARIRGVDSPVRMVGLSATAANADQVAEWLGADLVQIAWRPTRQTQQVLTLPPGDRQSEGRSRNHVTAEIVRDVTADGGSTLVFCGAKANVRSTALALAASRGVRVTEVSPDDLDEVHRVCAEAGVALHYSDWPHKAEAERLFRNRDIDVLVATSTLAAGVNTPARVVIVRDTSIGPTPMEVSMVQQMFGRAGRAGQEVEGWSFLLATPDETIAWRRRLSDGYTIHSGIQAGIADHLLGEIVQGHVTTLREAEAWWVRTLAHHQGSHSLTALHAARDYLATWRFLEVTEAAQADQDLKPTPLGSLTSKMMVGVKDAADLIAALTRLPAPRHHQPAEEALIETLVTRVSALSSAPDAPADQAPAVSRIVAARGDMTMLGRTPPPRSPGLGRVRVSGEEVCKAALLLVARSPRVFVAYARQVAGVNRSLFTTALYEAPRYLAWLAALGPLGVVPAWTCVVAADLGRRVAWHRTGAPLGAGRLLALCEKMTGPVDAPRLVPDLFTAAVRAGATRPETWPLAGPPDGMRLDSTRYSSALADRLTLRMEGASISATPGAAVFAANGGSWRRVSMSNGKGTATGLVAAFGGKGDALGTGWLENFSRMHL